MSSLYYQLNTNVPITTGSVNSSEPDLQRFKMQDGGKYSVLTEYNRGDYLKNVPKELSGHNLRSYLQSLNPDLSKGL